jgi:hypothetical protein
MSVRRSSSPRLRWSPQPRAAGSLPSVEPSLVAPPSRVLPTVSSDPFVQARRLWGQVLLKVHHALAQEDC